jgi:hypothetical protein
MDGRLELLPWLDVEDLWRQVLLAQIAHQVQPFIIHQHQQSIIVNSNNNNIISHYHYNPIIALPELRQRDHLLIGFHHSSTSCSVVLNQQPVYLHIVH